MTCDDTRRRLTAYLDGDLDSDGGTLVRVHLRGCPACRQVASDEAALRDGLRALPALDPPPSLWAGVQARLAAAEAAEAARPRWRRALARWAPAMPRLLTGGLVAAAAVSLLWWRTHRADEPAPSAPPPREVIVQHPTKIEPSRTPDLAPRPPCNIPEASDATADLALDDARRSGCYEATIAGLLAQSGKIRAEWTDEQRSVFDDRIATMRNAVTKAAEGRPRHRAYRSMLHYLENALARDEVVAIASGGIP